MLWSGRQRQLLGELAHTNERSKRFMYDLPFDLHFQLGGRDSALLEQRADLVLMRRVANQIAPQ
jgi:hypothetical protein